MLAAPQKQKKENNQDYGYRVIKNAIMFLELIPGQVLSEAELSEILQISRTPIREVMTKLKEENLIEVIPQVGTYVTKISPKVIEQARFMRFTLEKEVLKEACKNFSDEKMDELKWNLQQQKRIIGKKEAVRDFHHLDSEFHRIIFEGTNKENVWDAIVRLSTHYNRMRLLSEIEHSFDNAILQHEKMVDIIEQKKIEEVESIMTDHVIKPRELWLELNQETSPYYSYFEDVE